MTNRHPEPCQHCGKPMLVAQGGIKRVGMSMVKNPDQDAQFHRECRAEGRRLRHKVFKKHRKAQSK